MKITVDDLNLEGRDDIFLKVGYARALLTGKEDRFSKRTYLEHLACWNNFFEEEPRKTSPGEFLTTFQSLAKDFTSGNFSSLLDSIPVNENFQPQNGGHRISLLLAAQQIGLALGPASFHSIVERDRGWNFEFFKSHGLSPASLRSGLLEKSRAGRLTALIIWPRAMGYKTEINSVLDAEGLSNRLSFDVTLDKQQLLGFVAHAYWGEDWARSYDGLRSKAVEAGLEGPINISFLPPLGATTARIVKERIRSEWGGGFQGVHSSDNADDSHRLVSLSTDQDSLHFLRLISWSYVFGNFAKLLDTASREIEPKERQFFAFSGSTVLAIAGGREPADTDFLIADSEEDMLGWSNHRSYLRFLGIEGDDIVLDSAKHIWFLGYRFIHPQLYDAICSARGEEKDIASDALRKAILASLDAVKTAPDESFPGPLKLSASSPKGNLLGWRLVALGFRMRNGTRLLRKRLRKSALRAHRRLGILCRRFRGFLQLRENQ